MTGLRRHAPALALAVGILTAGCATAPTAPSGSPSAVATTPGGATSSAAPVSVAEPAGPAAVMARSAPVRLRIPAIAVDSDLMGLGLQGDGTLEVPPAGFPAGWFTGAPTPGEQGPAVIAGHVDWDGAPGVFADLADLAAGDRVTVERADGSEAVFEVRSVSRLPKQQFPTDAVYGDLDHAGLRLITCGGAFDEQAGSYLDQTIVFADLVPPTAG